MECPFEPLNDWLVVVKPGTQETSDEGIIYPPSSQPEKVGMEVVAVGPGRKNLDGTRQEMPVRVGDVVLPGHAIEMEVTYRGVDYFVMREMNVIAKVREE